MPTGPVVENELQLYLKEIKDWPLLNAEQEKELCWRIIQHNCPISRERMIRSNLRLVVNIAKRYTNRSLPLTDLINEGNIGLLHAVEAFDPEQGARFSTYATWWIKQSIRHALHHAGYMVHVPAYMIEWISLWKQKSNELENQLSRPPSTQELAQAMDVTPRKLRMIRDAARIRQRPTDGLDYGGDILRYTDILSDHNSPKPHAEMLRSEDITLINEMLDAIDNREAEILKLRFGLNGEEPMTLNDIGTKLGLSRERVRQIELNALQKLNGKLAGDARLIRKNLTAEPVPVKKKGRPRKTPPGATPGSGQGAKAG
jgi:RNA polymerase primary sigma factor